MIIGTEKQLVIGARHVGLSDNDGTPHIDQPFTVLRVATAAEYFAEAEADGVPLSRLQREHALAPSSYFYDVAID